MDKYLCWTKAFALHQLVSFAPTGAGTGAKPGKIPGRSAVAPRNVSSNKDECSEF